jgi:imidazole glycerol-phosphate synthase subunit HisH
VIAILNYGMGNLTSVRMALEHVGARVEVSEAVSSEADGLVLPGVGAFPKAMAELERRGLDEQVREFAAVKPVLGICLGMQLLFRSSTEMGGAEGLALLEGDVVELDAAGLKVPQIGWNEVRWRADSPLSAGLPERTAMYHVHSFAPRADDPDVILGTAAYGNEFVTAVGSRNVFGVQFHPEKSSTHGLALLRNFVRLTARVAA